MKMNLYKITWGKKGLEYVMSAKTRDEIYMELSRRNADCEDWVLVKEDLWLTEQMMLERLGVAKYVE